MCVPRKIMSTIVKGQKAMIEILINENDGQILRN